MPDPLPARRALLATMATGALAGCVVAPWPGYPVDEGPVVAVPPPDPRVEYPGPPPAAGHVWIGGYWDWRLGRHVWIGGRWALPPPRHHWVPGAWNRYGPGWRWRGGHWRRR